MRLEADVRRVLLSLILLLVLAPGASAQTLLEAATVLTGLFNAYAPTVLGSRMWIGGWATPADFPYDKIYRSDLVAGSWTFPETVLERSDASVNDPSVVVVPAGSTNLYYTLLPRDCGPQPHCLLSDNFTGLARSGDGGLTWIDLGVLIGRDNGLGPCGAWAPSALVVGGELWLYYHGGNPSFGVCEHPSGTVFRSRFDPTGQQRVDTVVVTVPLPVVNVDVSRRPDGLLVMVANSLDLTKIYLFTSTDGLTWSKSGPPLVDAGLVWAPTPHVTWVDAAHFDLWLAWGQVVGNTFLHEVQRWRWSE